MGYSIPTGLISKRVYHFIRRGKNGALRGGEVIIYREAGKEADMVVGDYGSF